MPYAGEIFGRGHAAHSRGYSRPSRTVRGWLLEDWLLEAEEAREFIRSYRVLVPRHPPCFVRGNVQERLDGGTRPTMFTILNNASKSGVRSNRFVCPVR